MSTFTAMPVLSRRARAQTIEALARTHFDIVVIGGGVTGAGAAQDAATRGLRVALVEQGDCAAATSSRSGRLIHGGRRYLEQFDRYRALVDSETDSVVVDLEPSR
jgi:glycerol-3-phosphate dehydrogenase